MSKREVKALRDEGRAEIQILPSRTRKGKEKTRAMAEERVRALEEELADARRLAQEAERRAKEASEEVKQVSADHKKLQEQNEELHGRLKEGPGSVATTTPTKSSEDQAELLKCFQKMLEMQSKMLATQANAVAVQNFPPLPSFTGEDIKGEQDEFEHWIKRFEERARLASWSDEQKFSQFKLHLGGYALRVFNILDSSCRDTYDKAVKNMKKRFRSLDIPELCGLDFHKLTQSTESIEALGVELQRLCRKAFPTSTGTDRDRLLKGRFFQALLPRWQRKLGAPKLDESFMDLYDRARVLEKHDEQYSAAAKSRGDTVKKEGKSQPPKDSPRDLQPKSENSSKKRDERRARAPGCFLCGDLRHMAKNCPVETRKETPGRSKKDPPSRSASLVSELLQNLSGDELEQILRECQLRKEEGLAGESTVGTVTAQGQAQAVGPTLYCNVSVEGVPVRAMVDTGSQSTIISRSFLHKIVRQKKTNKEPDLVYKLPGVRLFGKDGPQGSPEILVTAELDLSVQAGDKVVQAPVLVQPTSEQECLIGMNVAPGLGLLFLDAQKEPLLQVSPNTSETTSVSLIQTIRIPGRMGQFVQATVKGSYPEDTALMFEPNPTLLSSQGLSSHDAVLKVDDDGKVLIPLMNYSPSPTDLEEGAALGSLAPVQLDDSDSPPLATSASSCLAVQAQGKAEKWEQLRPLLELDMSSDITDEQKQQLEDLLKENADVFALSNADLGCTTLVKHRIETGEHLPVRQQPYRAPYAHRGQISNLIDDMLAQDVVQPSNSPWASPVVLVPKKDGTSRFCVDYRKLNSVTKKDVYPLPRIDDILDTLGQAHYFTTLDLASGYWQIELDPATREKSAFTTHRGLFEFQRMPFGLCNAPSTFQRLMQVVLAGLEWQCCFVYIDDILVCSRTFEEHLANLREVFSRLRMASLKLKPKKCSFLQAFVTYLGFVISKYGISPDDTKVDKVKNYPVPKDVTQVRQFLGLASYYRRFISNFARVASPLYALTKKGQEFLWTPRCQESFAHLKSLLITAPVLSYPQFGEGKEFTVETDASTLGLGAVLSQRQEDGYVHPIAYASRQLHDGEKNYGATELETLGIVWALKHFRHYLLGHKCILYTDHAACTSMLKTGRPTSKLARWALVI